MKSKHSNRYWCSGKLYCEMCGQRYVSRTKKLKNGTTYKAWRCYAAANHGTSKVSDDGEVIGCDNGSINERALLTCVHYCICQLQTNQKELKKEILQEIKAIKGITDKKLDTKRITEKMESLNAKKRKAIDLMLDGLITKADLQEQTNGTMNSVQSFPNCFPIHRIRTKNKQCRLMYLSNISPLWTRL